MMYFALLVDMSVFSTRISAFVLIFFRVLSEVTLFLFALCVIILSFSCAVSSLEHTEQDFSGLTTSGLNFMRVSLGMYPRSRYDYLQEEPALFAVVMVFLICSVIYLGNILIAQLNS